MKDYGEKINGISAATIRDSGNQTGLHIPWFKSFTRQQKKRFESVFFVL